NVVPDTRLHRTAATVDIEFSVDKGKLVDVNRIKIRGNTKTYDHVIRRELRINEQDQYSSSKVERSKRLLQRLGYFEEVDISSETVEGEDDKVDLLVNVREASTGTFSAGAGFSTSDGALFNVRLSENNVLGAGRRAVLNADLGTERENFSISLQDPRLDDSFWSGEADLLRTQREFNDFDRELQGGSLTIGYPLEEFFGEWSEDVSFSVKYEYLDINISNVDLDDAAPLVIASEGSSKASGFTPRLVRNTIDNPLNPSDGSRQVLSVELTGIGGNEEYYLIEGQNQLYYPLGKTSIGDFIFSWRTRVGYGKTFNGEDFPLFRRYFPGGINSVRGFDERSLGPVDEDGNEFGGSKQLVNNLELIFPLFQSAGIKGVIFYDVGEAFDDDENITVSDLRQAYGFGIRWASPLGPIRVELGFPIDREPGEDSSVTLFSFGAPL
ncbi:MAG: outer membrane protein assembly factor BamA, partial [Bdellovibrionales bacterium]|nr:outer membrane protein assembly factor BamA [Bdellovibrionales bacterium]